MPLDESRISKIIHMNLGEKRITNHNFHAFVWTEDYKNYLRVFRGKYNCKKNYLFLGDKQITKRMYVHLSEDMITKIIYMSWNRDSKFFYVHLDKKDYAYNLHNFRRKENYKNN